MSRADEPVPSAGAAAAPMLRVSVAFATAERCRLIEVEVPAGSTLRDAVLASGLLAAEPALEAARLDLGVFGQRRRADALLADGDRVEVYRPLTVEPKEARRMRAAVRRRRAALAPGR